MEKKKNATRGPKAVVRNEEVADLFIRDFPVALRNKAKSKAAAMGIPLKDLAVLAFTEIVNTRSL